MVFVVCLLLGVAYLLSTNRAGQNPLAIFIGLPILAWAGYIFLGGAMGLVQ